MSARLIALLVALGWRDFVDIGRTRQGWTVQMCRLTGERRHVVKGRDIRRLRPFA